MAQRADEWGRFSFWLVQRAVADVTAAFGELDGHATALSREAAEAFEDDEAEAVGLAALRPPAIDATDFITSTSALDVDRNEQSSRRRVRRSLGRIDGAGVLEGLAMVSLNPISLAAGVLISRRAVQGSRAQYLNDQRTAAIDSVRRYVEEAEFIVRQRWRRVAAARRLERELRVRRLRGAGRLAGQVGHQRPGRRSPGRRRPRGAGVGRTRAGPRRPARSGGRRPGHRRWVSRAVPSSSGSEDC